LDPTGVAQFLQGGIGSLRQHFLEPGDLRAGHLGLATTVAGQRPDRVVEAPLPQQLLDPSFTDLEPFRQLDLGSFAPIICSKDAGAEIQGVRFHALPPADSLEVAGGNRTTNDPHTKT
jgi:hypothetical protein